MSETSEQKALFELLRRAEGRYPILAFVFHVPGEANGGGKAVKTAYAKADGSTGWRSTPIEAIRNAEMGYRPGVWDVWVPFRNRTAIWGYRARLFSGLVIEMKSARGTLSPEQKTWRDFLTSQGWACQMRRNWEVAARDILIWAGAVPEEWGL